MAQLKYSLKTKTDIDVPIPEADKTVCKICNIQCKNNSALAGHVGAKHKIKLEDYLIKFYMDNARPLCPSCGKETRYLKGEYCFKKYCSEHANESRKEWCSEKGYGKNGLESWRKGLTKETNDSILKHSSTIKGKGNHSFLSEDLFNKKCSSIIQNSLSIITNYEDFKGTEEEIKIKCNTCEYEFNKVFKTLLTSPYCPRCDSGKSLEEKEVFDYVSQISSNTLRNVRNVISKEIDILSDDGKFAIEYNGLYWHTEDRVGQKYHASKTEECKKNNIKLMHIFSDEWKNKKQIVESMISNRMKANKEKINARDCSVVETESNKDLEEYFNNTHISGHARFKKAFYLKHNDEVVAALSLRTAFHKKYNNMLEIARFSSKLNTNVVGAFSKLMKYVIVWSKLNSIENILTYADLRFGEGEVYLKYGFQYIGKTRLDYWYTDGKIRYNRFKYRAQLNKTEKEVAEENGVKKIYGCGNNIYILKL